MNVARARLSDVVAASLVAVAAPALFVARGSVLGEVLGYVALTSGVALAFARNRALGRDLSLIAVPLLLISLISVEANLEWGNIALMGSVLTACVAYPYLMSRFVFREHAVRFPGRPGEPWSRGEWAWLAAVLVLGYSILPVYFITSGSYHNWPAVESPSEIARLFVGVGFVGIWDELFFICVVFALLRRHFSLWVSNALQAVVFASFLWELGYRSWGPALTVPFALIQGWIFEKSRSVFYIVTVHLLFDVVVFLVLVYAHHPTWVPIFLVPPPVAGP
ncbi:MAG: CPBP family intramembrane metalloprotease [Microbacteriaceae bacterium]|nr:CPBP family intramembrane metalloprotease [Microbacteriaceae bacterium]